MATRSFFRWLPTAIILWVIGVFYAVGAILSLLAARQAAQGYNDPQTLNLFGDSHLVERSFERGAITNALVATLCILGWYLMRRRRSSTIALGGIAVIFAAFIICRQEMFYLIRGAAIENWIEMVFELPFLLYVIIYAHRECRKAAA